MVAKTIILQRNRYLLAGLLAFAVLVATQVSVQAYNFGGGWRAVQLVGQAGLNSWQLVGDALVDSDLNVAEMPSLTTGTATVSSSGNQVTIRGSVSNIGAYNSYSYRWRYGYSPSSMTNTTALTLATTTGSFSTTVTADTTRTLYYRFEVMSSTVTAVGSTLSTTSGRSTGFTLLRAVLTLVIGAATILWVMRNGVSMASLLGVIIGIVTLVVVLGMVG